MKQQTSSIKQAPTILDYKSQPFTSIYQYSQSVGSVTLISQIGINKIDAMFEEVSKATYEDCKEEDTPEEQQRKL